MLFSSETEDVHSVAATVGSALGCHKEVLVIVGYIQSDREGISIEGCDTAGR